MYLWSTVSVVDDPRCWGKRDRRSSVQGRRRITSLLADRSSTVVLKLLAPIHFYVWEKSDRAFEILIWLTDLMTNRLVLLGMVKNLSRVHKPVWI